MNPSSAVSLAGQQPPAAAAARVGMRPRAARVVITSVVALLAVGYAALGWQWWHARAQSAALEAAVVQAATRQRTPAAATSQPPAAAQLAALDDRVALARAPFATALSDELLATLAAAAQRAAVRLVITSAGEPSVEERHGLLFQRLPVSVRVAGTPDRLLGFVGTLADALPGSTVDGLRMGAFETTPFAQLEVSVLQSPTIPKAPPTPVAMPTKEPRR